MTHSTVEEAKRCLHCKVPGCRKGCPIGTNIPEMISQYLSGGITEAGRMLFENNPLSAICALVCDHGKQCEGHCVLGIKGQSVNIGIIENYVSEHYLDAMDVPEVHKRKEDKVAVIGGGPAGMTIAIRLAMRGYDVTIFESKPRIGGVLRSGIPEFRLPKALIDKYEVFMRKLGIRIKPNVTVGKPYGIDELFRDGFKAISFGTGVAWPNNLGIKGETLAHVHYGVHYLIRPDVYDLGENVVVIGGGNVAIDAARTALRHGVRNVSIVVRGCRLNANPHEAEMAALDGARFIYNKAPVEITDDGVYLSDTVTDENNKVVSVSAERELYAADSILIAIGQKASIFILKQTPGLHTTSNGLAMVNDVGETDRPGLFASGDVVRGAKTVVEAVELSKKVADAMDEYVRALNARKSEESAVQS